MLSPDIPQQFVPIRSAQPKETQLIYVPMLMGAAQVRFADAKSGVDVTEDVALLASDFRWRCPRKLGSGDRSGASDSGPGADTRGWYPVCHAAERCGQGEKL